MFIVHSVPSYCKSHLRLKIVFTVSGHCITAYMTCMLKPTSWIKAFFRLLSELKLKEFGLQLNWTKFTDFSNFRNSKKELSILRCTEKKGNSIALKLAFISLEFTCWDPLTHTLQNQSFEASAQISYKLQLIFAFTMCTCLLHLRL